MTLWREFSDLGSRDLGFLKMGTGERDSVLILRQFNRKR